MSKQQTQPTGKPEVHGSKFNQALAALNKLAKANKEKYAKINGLKMIAVILLCIALDHIFGHSVATGCALYAFANDGVISGRQSNSVKTRNGVERMFVVPRLVQNAYTSTARALLSLFSSGWAALSQAERDTWLAVTNVFKSNRLGRSIKVSGKNLFVQRNTNLLNAGAGVINTYVPSDGVSSSILNDATVTTTAGVITTATAAFAVSPTNANTEHLVYATAPLPAGVSRPEPSAFRLITVIPNGSATPFNFLPAYTVKFGNIAAIGQKVGVKFIPVDNTTGQAGTPSIFVAEVA